MELNVPRLAGWVVAIAAFALVVLSRVQLGKSFSVTPKASALVTNGLYSRIRHPMYVFMDLTVLGLALALDSWWVLPLQVGNARRENKLLAERFGTDYRNWRSRTRL